MTLLVMIHPIVNNSILTVSISCKVMIIVAWNGSELSSVFDIDVFKKALSVFITAAILKLGQGTECF